MARIVEVALLLLLLFYFLLLLNFFCLRVVSPWHTKELIFRKYCLICLIPNEALIYSTESLTNLVLTRFVQFKGCEKQFSGDLQKIQKLPLVDISLPLRTEVKDSTLK